MLTNHERRGRQIGISETLNYQGLIKRKSADIRFLRTKFMHNTQGFPPDSLRATKFRIWSTSVIKEYMRRGYVVNRNAVSEQKYEDLKKAVGLLENVFSKELLLTSDQATDLFDVIRDYTYALDTLDAYDYQSLKIADTTAPGAFRTS